MTETKFRTCPLCEATCGLAITLDGDQVTKVRGDEADVFSRGYVCPKGIALGELHNDAARLRYPLIRGADGRHHRATWDEAWAEIDHLLRPVREAHGNGAIGLFLGNPNVHNSSTTLYAPALIRALGTRNVFTASTVDQMPTQVAAGLMFGTGLSIPIPDIDRTDFMLVLGANPLVSNGSLWTAPDMPARLRALKARGGRLVVVDPIRTRTAQAADEHVRIRPGTDAFLVAAMARTIIADGLARIGAAEAHLAEGSLAELEQAVAPFTPGAVAPLTGIPADVIVRLAREMAAAPSAAIYGRMGTTTAGVVVDGRAPQSFGTAASWLMNAVNIVTGNLDREGGVMWPLPAAGGPSTSGTSGVGHGIRIPGAERTRVRGLASVLGEFPAAALAEEIDTPSPDGTRLRGLITIAGNPVLSTPDGGRLDAALATLDVMVSIDAYLTETTRHAHVVLPAPSSLARGHYDIAFTNLAVRNVANWSPPSVALRNDDDAHELGESEILLRFACLAAGGSVTPEAMDDLVALEVATRASKSRASRAHGREPGDLLAAVSPRRGVERLLDLMIRSGPYGDGFGSTADGLTLASLEAAPHGLDLGPLKPRLPEVLRTPSGAIELAPPQLISEAARMADVLQAAGLTTDDRLLLVGRRSLRSNNSWMHNIPLLAKGSNQCTLWLSPQDASRVGISDGDEVSVASDVASVVVTVEVTDVVSDGVVSLPHGWGHLVPGTWGPVAMAQPGVNSNLLTPSDGLDELSGTAVLNGIPVTVSHHVSAAAKSRH
jgi:anaerobic selenocysteine-containing dehydrogenase